MDILTTDAGIFIPRDRLEAWAQRNLSAEDMRTLATAIGNSSVPDAVATITDGFDGAPDGDITAWDNDGKVRVVTILTASYNPDEVPAKFAASAAENAIVQVNEGFYHGDVDNDPDAETEFFADSLSVAYAVTVDGVTQSEFTHNE